MTDEEKKPYHTIMVSAWRLFTKERTPERFSYEWWEEISGDYDKLREPYKGTPLDLYVCHINQAFLDEYERLQKRERPERVSTPVLPQEEEYTQEELHFPAPVPEVGGSEESNQTLTASDWGSEL